MSLTVEQYEEKCIIASALLAARIARPYYARAIAALTPVARPGLGTVAVDRAWRLYYDPLWLASLSTEHQGLVIGAHEVEHLLRDHMQRARAIDAEPIAWNLAGDCEINDDMTPVDLPEGGLRPAHIGATDGLCAEDYYRHLLDTATTTHTPLCGGGSGAGCPRHDEAAGPSAGGPPGVSESDAEPLRDAVAADIRAYTTTYGRGTVPAGIAIWADARAVSPPSIPWPRRLSAALAHGARTTLRGRADWSWSRLSRRCRPAGPLRPGTVTREPKLVIVVDTSGSMAEAGGHVLGVVSALWRRYGSAVTIQAETAITRRSTSRVRHWRGGGGTDLTAAILAAAAESDLVAVITDGITPWPTVAPRVPVLVLLVAPRSDVPTWAQVTHCYDISKEIDDGA